ncbi:MAG: hypothetical protein OEV43_00915 [Coriobacteriia bacterium]|nr:hypothetical protein [Coriobacteriia bacterium]
MRRISASRVALGVAATAFLVVWLAPSIGFADPIVSSAEKTAAGEPLVALDKETPAVSSDSAFHFNVRVSVDRPTEYLESRLQIRRPSGRLIFQKTFVRNEVATGTASFEYARELGDLDLDAGAYPVELRVRSDAGGVREWIIEDDLLVYDSATEPVPVVLVAKIDCILLTDPEGRFSIDPADADLVREQVERLAALALSDLQMRVSLVGTPVMFEEWYRVSQGYELIAPEGVKEVPADDPTAVKYRETLQLLKTAMETGRLELLHVPYADPDIEGLRAMMRTDDLSVHFERGLTACLTSLQTTPAAGTMLAGGVLPSDALSPLAQNHVSFVLVEPESLAVTSTASGCYSLDTGGMSALLIDRTASNALSTGDCPAFLTRVFKGSLSETPTNPIVAMLRLGAGHRGSADLLQNCVRSLADTPWTDFALASEVLKDPLGSLELPEIADTGPDAPGDYWPLVAESRRWSEGLASALGTTDQGALAAIDDSLVAESHCWAGPDGTWALADRGRSYAAAASRKAQETLDAVSVAAKDITLSSARGDVPVSVINDTDRSLVVALRTSAEGMVIRQPGEQSLVLKPAENYHTVPVDLQSSLSGQMRVELWAGDVLLDETTVRVRASYLDRLAITGGVVALLAGILLFIVRRTTRALPTDTIHRKIERGDRRPEDHGDEESPV